MAKKSLKDALYQYFAQAHFNAMSAEQFARFKDYIKAKDFQGNMRWWEKSFMENGEKKPVPDFIADGDYQLSGEEWIRLYDWFQGTLESMYTNLDDEYAHTLFVPGFVKKWFGPGKIFQSTEASEGTKEALDALATFLKTEDGKKLGDTLKRSPQLRDVFSGELTFDAFVAKLEAKEYNKDLKFRKKVNDVVAYISQYMPQPGENAPYKSNWPQVLGYDSDRNEYTGYQTVKNIKEPLKALHKYFDSNNASSWINKENEEDRFKFDETKKTDLVDIFKQNYQPLLNTFVTGEKKIREEFQKHEPGTGSLITEQLNKAFKDTDYDNKESKDYIVPKQTEERNFVDRIKKFKDDTYDNYFKQFFEPRYGAHVYHTTYARTVGEAFDKVGIKPSGGIDGILAKKDDIIKEINKKAAGKALKHFNWFCTTMEEIKKSIPKAYNDALRNPHQMRAVVSQIIIKALKTKPYDDGEAKTAMELLALTRYGVMASRFREGLSEGLKDVKLFSDKDLSWNKNEGIKFVTGAIDTTLKLGLKTLAFAGTGGYNLVKNRFKRKFGKDISGNADLAAAYKAWKANDEKAFKAECDAAAVNKSLYENGYAKSGVEVKKSNVDKYGAWVFYKKFGNLFDIVSPKDYETVKKELSKKSEKDITDPTEKAKCEAIEKYDKLLGDKYVKQYLKEHNLWDGKTQITPVLLETGFAKVNSEHTNFDTIDTTAYTNAVSAKQNAAAMVQSISSQLDEIKSKRLQEIKKQLEQIEEKLKDQESDEVSEQIKNLNEEKHSLLSGKTRKYNPRDTKKKLENIKKQLAELQKIKSNIDQDEQKKKKLEQYTNVLKNENSDFSTDLVLDCFDSDDKTNIKKLNADLYAAKGDLSDATKKFNDIKSLTPEIAGYAANATDLEDDVVKYKKLMLYAQQKQTVPDNESDEEKKRIQQENDELQKQKQKQWRKDNADDYAKLIAFWDELDTFTKTHSFKFGNMKLRRDLWLKNFNRDKDAGVISPMEEEANEFAESYYDNITYDR